MEAMTDLSWAEVAKNAIMVCIGIHVHTMIGLNKRIINLENHVNLIMNALIGRGILRLVRMEDMDNNFSNVARPDSIESKEKKEDDYPANWLN